MKARSAYRWKRWILVAAALAWPSSATTAELAPGDGVPPGTVAFFSFDDPSEGCPDGWVASEEVAGRLVVGTTVAENVGVLVNTPLADGEDRTHVHPYAATVELPPKNIAGANGGNNQGAASGGHAVEGDTDGAPSGLPFVQLTVCTKS